MQSCSKHAGYARSIQNLCLVMKFIMVNYTMTFQMKEPRCLKWLAFTRTMHALSGQNIAEGKQGKKPKTVKEHNNNNNSDNAPTEQQQCTEITFDSFYLCVLTCFSSTAAPKNWVIFITPSLLLHSLTSCCYQRETDTCPLLHFQCQLKPPLCSELIFLGCSAPV